MTTIAVALHPDDHPDHADLGAATIFSTIAEALAAAAPGERVWAKSETPWVEVSR